MLPQKQENFVNNIFKGMTQREAWIKAGYSSNYSVAIIDIHACQLAAKDKIKVRLEEMRQAAKSGLIADVTERKERLTEQYGHAYRLQGRYNLGGRSALIMEGDQQ